MTDFQRERLACAWFFGGVGLVYGIFTSRLPALREMTAANDAQIGFLLLAFGGSAFLGLLSSGYLVEKLGSGLIACLAVTCTTIAITIAALAINYWQLLAFCVIGGLSNGMCDVAMNAQGIIIERRYKRLCMSSLHASFSLCGALGSLTGSLFAALGLSPFLNFLIVACGYLLLAPWAYRNTASAPAPEKAVREKRVSIPFFVYFLGLMSMLCYVSEGSAGEWGSVLLHSVKNASQQEAALVFACFCTSMVIGRFFGDRLRSFFGEFQIVFAGSLLGAISMAIVLLSPWPLLCLGAYFLMGVGFAPIVPIFFSMSGRIPGVSPGRASSTISILAYTGMLFFPPFLGMLGEAIGLNNALWVIVICCAAITAGSFVLRARARKRI